MSEKLPEWLVKELDEYFSEYTRRLSDPAYKPLHLGYRHEMKEKRTLVEEGARIVLERLRKTADRQLGPRHFGSLMPAQIAEIGRASVRKEVEEGL